MHYTSRTLYANILFQGERRLFLWGGGKLHALVDGKHGPMEQWHSCPSPGLRILLPSEWKANDKVKKGISSIYGMGQVFMMQGKERDPRRLVRGLRIGQGHEESSPPGSRECVVCSYRLGNFLSQVRRFLRF